MRAQLGAGNGGRPATGLHGERERERERQHPLVGEVLTQGALAAQIALRGADPFSRHQLGRAALFAKRGDHLGDCGMGQCRHQRIARTFVLTRFDANELVRRPVEPLSNHFQLLSRHAAR